MSILSFIAGLGGGATLATLLFLLFINRLVARRKGDEKAGKEVNDASLVALEVRNQIGAQQADALHRIAGHLAALAHKANP